MSKPRSAGKSVRRYLRAALLGLVTAVSACGGGASSNSGSSGGTTSGTTPVAGFSYLPAAPTASQSVQFTDTSTGTPTAWSWSFGDGSTSTSQNPTHTYSASGSFSVTLTVTNAKGANAKTQSLTVSASTTRTIGLISSTSAVSDGYVLFAPKQNTMTYLIDTAGRVVHSWTASKYSPGQSVYLLENGNLLRSCMTKATLSSGGGEGGRVELYDWNDNLLWQFDYATDTYMQHHDIRRLPNGNILMLVVEKKTYAEVLAAGFNPNKLQPEVASKGYMLPDSIVEVQPTYPVGGIVVWEWHVWEHLIQDYDASKNNYGVVAAHPELIDAAGDQKNLPAFWNHMNSIDYNASLDQIAVSVRGNSEVWIIDHGTTTAQAQAHTGGRRGKGGDLLYRWGNPICYRAGTASDQRYFQQHDVEWIRSDCPGAGNFTCFNNGLGRSSSYSTVDEFTPAVNSDGSYTMVPGTAVGPREFVWTYQGTTAEPMYSMNISGAQRLPGGNTIICAGGNGVFLEVTPAKDVAWRYISPVDNTGPLKQGTTPPADPARPDAGETMNSVFRIYKYLPTYAAFTGRALTPGSVIEK